MSCRRRLVPTRSADDGGAAGPGGEDDAGVGMGKARDWGCFDLERNQAGRRMVGVERALSVGFPARALWSC